MRLENVSCFDFLPSIESNSIDLVLIDPPYQISKDTGFHSCVEGEKRFMVSYKFGEWDENFTGLQIAVEETYRVLKNSGTFICFYDLWKIETLKNMMEEAGYKQIRFLEWIKTNPVPINSKVNYLTNCREVAVLGVKKGKPTFNSEYDNGIYKYPICHEKGRFHPTQKPLKLIEDLVVKHSNEGDTVLDFTMGSGSTGIACLNTNRNFIGIELDEKYYNIAKNRLKEAK